MRSLTPAAALALLAVYVLWGSTAPAIKIAVATLPPWYMAALRFAVAGGLLWSWVRLRRAALPTRREWLHAALTGTLLLVLGNGIFTWCLQFVPAGIGALFFSLSPLFMALFAVLLLGERITRVAGVGLLLGFAGMLSLIAPVGATKLPTIPALMAVLCAISWALGSIVQRRLVPRDLVQASAMQMLSAAIVLAAFGAFSNERLTPAAFTPAALGALVFLVLGGSIVGYSCYLWLLHNVSSVVASTYAYVNPIVALAIAVAFLHEPFGLRTAIAAGVIVAGVALIMGTPRRIAVPAEGEIGG